jgi:hypothetical protein
MLHLNSCKETTDLKLKYLHVKIMMNRKNDNFFSPFELIPSKTYWGNENEARNTLNDQILLTFKERPLYLAYSNKV